MSVEPSSVEPRVNTARGSTEFVQPIAVLKTGSHWATIKAAAAASVLAYLNDAERAPQWDEWLAGPFAKSVRRTDEAGLRKARSVEPHAEVRIGDAVALATRPYMYADLPKALARMQVAGTDLPREEAPEVSDPLFTVFLTETHAMTTGKSAAQVAHATFLVVRDHLTPAAQAQWLADPSRFDVVPTHPGALRSLARQGAPVVIHDAGHTEVGANTLTAVAREGRRSCSPAGLQCGGSATHRSGRQAADQGRAR